MQLYTSLVRLKQGLNGGILPPMTPIPDQAKHLIDPAFTVGLGGLEEDAENGLRCPVRGCGVYRHNLGVHIAGSHRSVGGVLAVKRALSIPKSAAFISQKLRDNTNRVTPRPNGGRLTSRRVKEMAAKGLMRRRPRSRMTVGAKNLRDRCVAQLTHRMLDLNNSLGRSPTAAEARSRWGGAIVTDIIRTFGSWANAKAQCGLGVYRRNFRRLDTAGALAALEAYYNEHGTLPNVDTAYRNPSTPLLPAPTAIMRALKTDSWPAAMQIAASMLNIYGGRHGLPEKKAS